MHKFWNNTIHTGNILFHISQWFDDTKLFGQHFPAFLNFQNQIQEWFRLTDSAN